MGSDREIQTRGRSSSWLSHRPQLCSIALSIAWTQTCSDSPGATPREGGQNVFNKGSRCRRETAGSKAGQRRARGMHQERRRHGPYGQPGLARGGKLCAQSGPSSERSNAAKVPLARSSSEILGTSHPTCGR